MTIQCLIKKQYLIGVLKYGNSALEGIGINEGDLVGYTPNGEYDFVVDGKRLYCMKSNDIVIKYERQGNETEYNPAGHKAVEELIKVAKEAIVDSDDDISADRLKNAAATKKLAIFDAFEILNRIQEEEDMLNEKPKEEERLSFWRFCRKKI